MEILEIREEKGIKDFLEKRNLLNQYKNNKEKLLNWYLWKIDFKSRKPKQTWVYSFRINKQFRAIWYFREKWVFIVIKIDNHQNY